MLDIFWAANKMIHLRKSKTEVLSHEKERRTEEVLRDKDWTGRTSWRLGLCVSFAVARVCCLTTT